jgi:hypothetical protein
MEPLEFDFMRERRRGFLDLDIPKYSRLPRPLTKIQMLKREVRSLDHRSREIFAGWLLWYDATAWERRFKREMRSETCKDKSGKNLTTHKSEPEDR